MNNKTALKIFLTAIFAFLFMFPLFSWAQDAVVAPSSDEIQALLKALGGIAGMKTLGIVALCTQALMLLSRFSFMANLLGKWRLLLVSLLTTVGVIVGQMATTGVSLGGALLSSTALVAIQVLVNQIYRQFIVKAT